LRIPYRASCLVQRDGEATRSRPRPARKFGIFLKLWGRGPPEKAQGGCDADLVQLMKTILVAIGFALLLHVAVAQYQVPPSGSAIATLNQYRVAMNLTPLRVNDQLTATARAHSEYISALLDRSVLKELTIDGVPKMHFEDPSNAKYTGTSSIDRARRHGYHYRASEQVSFMDSKTVKLTGPDAVESLIATVYHRSGLFNPAWSEFGDASDTNDVVFMFGEGAARGQVRQDWLAVFPTNQSTTARVGFQNEIPDPAPERPHQWLGLPISIHTPVDHVLKVAAFEVRERGTESNDPSAQGSLIEGKVLESSNDKLVKKNEVFFLPTLPLRYSSSFDVFVRLNIDDKPRSLNWSFKTPANPFNVLPVGPVIEVTPGNPTALDIPGLQSGYSWRSNTFPSGSGIKIEGVIDGKLTVDFPMQCNSLCKTWITVNNGGPHPSTEKREFVVAKGWLATRTEFDLLPKSFAEAVNDLSWQKPSRALAYFEEDGFWYMSRSSGKPDQSTANKVALRQCNAQAARRHSSKSCKLYSFAAKGDRK